MKTIDEYRFRKCTDINLEFPLFEVLDKNNSILMDISEDPEGEYQVLFHKDCILNYIPIQVLEKILQEGKILIEKEK